jgi:Holliday junction DNA helicase RuvA
MRDMIGYLEGKLRRLDATHALIVAGGVGYEVHISLATYYRLEGQLDVDLEIFTHVREDALSLYGFASSQEKTAFEKLIAIAGIGPTLAQKILSGIDAVDLADAISRGDTRKLSSIPGVGKKTAERMCLELRDKLLIEPERTTAAAGPRTSVDDDVQSALVNLGYRPRDAELAVEAAHKQLDEGAEFSVLLKASLKHLTR